MVSNVLVIADKYSPSDMHNSGTAAIDLLAVDLFVEPSVQLRCSEVSFTESGGCIRGLWLDS